MLMLSSLNSMKFNIALLKCYSFIFILLRIKYTVAIPY